MGRKSFNEKLRDSKDMPKVVVLTDPEAISRYRGEKMLIAPPLAYDQLMRQIPVGKVTTSPHLRAKLAHGEGADFTCPLTAGIFINLVARASQERGGDETPYWRTLKKDGELNEKFPGGIEDQGKRLQGEGHQIDRRGQRAFVRDYQEKLWPLAD